MHGIPSTVHGAIDYAYSLTLGFAPELFGYKDDRSLTTVLPRFIASGLVVYNLFTHYEWGVFRVIPYELHLLFDAILGAKLLATAWFFDSLTVHPRAIGVLTAFGAISLAVAMLSERRSYTAGAS